MLAKAYPEVKWYHGTFNTFPPVGGLCVATISRLQFAQSAKSGDGGDSLRIRRMVSMPSHDLR